MRNLGDELIDVPHTVMTIINHELEALVTMIDRSRQATGIRSAREAPRAEATSRPPLRRPDSATTQRRWSQKAAIA